MSYNFCIMKNLTPNNFTEKLHTMQLKMKFDVGTYVPEDSKVRLVCNKVEEMNLKALLSTYSKQGRKPAVDPINLLKVLLFCYSEGVTSSRKIEAFCKYDTRALFMLDGAKAPDHTTINRFRKTLEDFSSDLLNQFVELLIKENHVDLKTVYIDGTKLESSAGRYTFVWRKAIENYQRKLKERLIEELNLEKSSPLEVVIKAVRSEFMRVRNHCREEKIVFVYGSGKRKTAYQRTYEKLEEALSRFETYEKHICTMGTRNSYSKTDPDATFMRMKEDYMRNGQLKPAYNIQLASSGTFIVDVMGSQKSNDLHTLKSFLQQMLSKYKRYLAHIVADAGYESVENYAYLKAHKLRAYIKPSNYEVRKTKAFREDISKKENMLYLKIEDAYVCRSGNKLIRENDSTRKYDSGYRDTIHTYRCRTCIECPYNKKCIKSRKTENGSTKTIRFSPDFEMYRNDSLSNIKSPEGITHRINRSIQSEGMFSKLKDGLNYKRFRHRGLKSVISDLILMALGINLNKLYSKQVNNQSGVIEYKKRSLI